MRQAELTFVIFTLMVVGVVDVDMENTWTTLISKYIIPWKLKIDGAMGLKTTFFLGNYDCMVMQVGSV